MAVHVEILNRGHFRRKAYLDEGVSFARSFLKRGEESLYLPSWIEVATLSPGTGQLRSFNDETGANLSRLVRSTEILKWRLPLLPPQLRKEVILDFTTMKVYLLLNYASPVMQFGMELPVFVALLGLTFNFAARPNDMYIGAVSTRGYVYTTSSIVPSINAEDIYAMRKGGIRRLFLGKPEGDDLPMEELERAAQTDLHGGAEPMEVIVVPDLDTLFTFIPMGPTSIFPNVLGIPDEVKAQEKEEAEESLWVAAKRRVQKTVGAAASSMYGMLRVE